MLEQGFRSLSSFLECGNRTFRFPLFLVNLQEKSEDSNTALFFDAVYK